MQFISKNGTESSAYLTQEILNTSPWKKWLGGDVCDLFCKTIYDAFIEYKINPTFAGDGVKFGKNKMSAAFSLDHNFPFESIKELEYLQLFISEKLKEKCYIIQLSEDKMHINDERSLIIYQKPSFKLPLIDGKSDQLFGNIHLELRFKQEQLIFFKMIVHRYNDHKFDEGLEFDELMEFLFKINR
jgi:hypothetical protein